MTRNQNRFIASLAFFALFIVLAPALRADTVDFFKGVWRGTMTPDQDTTHDGGKQFDEALIFDNAEMMAENFAFYGFEGGEYTAEGEDGKTTHLTMTSGSKGTLVWEVHIVNTYQMTATAVWTKPDGIVWRFSFNGTKSLN